MRTVYVFLGSIGDKKYHSKLLLSQATACYDQSQGQYGDNYCQAGALQTNKVSHDQEVRLYKRQRQTISTRPLIHSTRETVYFYKDIRTVKTVM